MKNIFIAVLHFTLTVIGSLYVCIVKLFCLLSVQMKFPIVGKYNFLQGLFSAFFSNYFIAYSVKFYSFIQINLSPIIWNCTKNTSI